MCLKRILKLWMTVNILMIIGASTSLFAQSSFQMSVSGYVTNANTNLPKRDVIVTIFKWENEEIIDSYTAISDQDGFYKIRFLEAGKYEFHINTPEIGDMALMIHYWGGPIVSTFGKDCQFEMKEGWNLTLNLFIGENSYSYIERKNDLIRNEINFKVLYSTSIKKFIASNQFDYSSKTIKQYTGNDLLFIDPKVYIVEDNVKILDQNGKEAAAISDFFFIYDFRFSSECVDQKCQYNNIHPKWITWVTCHYPEWYDKIYPKIPGCYYDCVIAHEKEHINEFKDIATTKWQMIYNKEIFNTPCCIEDACKNRFFIKKSKMNSELDKYMKSRENLVTGNSDKCVEKCK